ncbi:hypothetical protein KIL84_013902 [Mauremys mutica]|uniref:Uncharacterized protein n=1 Tax=Mauremys mutica TaxID=74926 RepID=A0A9D3WWA7_9SAUR|nr:hypothetical protein KIL84_013902 [Mauremys mutica]
MCSVRLLNADLCFVPPADSPPHNLSSLFPWLFRTRKLSVNYNLPDPLLRLPKAAVLGNWWRNAFCKHCYRNGFRLNAPLKARLAPASRAPTLQRFVLIELSS